MRFSNSKQFVKSNSNQNSSLANISGELERDDDDPFSIKTLSINFLGIMIASLTILLPSVSVLLGRPLSQTNEITSLYTVKEDGP